MKILKLDNFKFNKMKKGGGTPPYIKASNLNNVDSIISDLESIPYYPGQESLFFVHKVEDEEKTIPAPSNRFMADIKYIFGDNKKEYITTTFDEDDNRLYFVYITTFIEIQHAISRLKIFKDMINEFLSSRGLTLADFLVKIYDESIKYDFSNYINNFKLEKQLSIWSYTGIRRFISGQEHQYGSLTTRFSKVDISNENSSTIVFASVSLKEEAKKELTKNRVAIMYEDDFELGVIGKFDKKLKGVVSLSASQTRTASLTTIEKQIERAMYDHLKLSEEEQHDVVIGVIDGGISDNSIVKNELYEYNDNKSLGFSSTNPVGSHAEQVCSTLLWNNKLGNESDNLLSPRVSLFNIVGDDNILQLKNKIRTVIAMNTSIKLWNISFVFNGLKNTKIISDMGVFFDKLQKEYEILCFNATGNIDKDDQYQYINSPSGSYSAMSIASVDEHNKPNDYSKKGYGYELPTKPDLAIFGGSDSKPIRVISNNLISETKGTSFAAPLVARKAAFLFKNGFDVFSIPAILNNYAQYYSYKNSIEDDSRIGNGVIPVDSSELMNLVDKRLMVVIRKDINEDYSQGFLDIKLPKTADSKYDFSFFISSNVGYRSESNPTFEYILESARVSFGKSIPNENKVLSETPDKRIDDMHEEGSHEKALRVYKGKFKNRDSFRRDRKRSAKDSFTYKGEKYNLEEWGIRIVRNSMRGFRNGPLPIAICFIFESPSILDFYQQFVVLNQVKLGNTNTVEEQISDSFDFS